MGKIKGRKGSCVKMIMALVIFFAFSGEKGKGLNTHLSSWEGQWTYLVGIIGEQ